MKSKKKTMVKQIILILVLVVFTTWLPINECFVPLSKSPLYSSSSKTRTTSTTTITTTITTTTTTTKDLTSRTTSPIPRRRHFGVIVESSVLTENDYKPQSIVDVLPPPSQQPKLKREEKEEKTQNHSSSNSSTSSSSRIETSSSSSSLIEKNNILVHKKGQSANMILRSPALAGFTLCKGWTLDTTNIFIQAINKVVEENPILSGHLYKKNKELWIQTGTYQPKNNHQFVKQIKLSNDQLNRLLSLSKNNDNNNITNNTNTNTNTPHNSIIDWESMLKENPSKVLSILTNEIVPLLDECELTSKQLYKKLPLLSSNLIILPNNYTIYSLKMSHAIGDGVTFFHILKQISLYMSNIHNNNNNNNNNMKMKMKNVSSSKQIPIPKIEWDIPLRTTHELYPTTYTKRDIEIAYGIPFLLGLLKNIPSLTKRKQHIILLDKQKINRKKRQIRKELLLSSSSTTTNNNNNDNNNENKNDNIVISSNDVITEAICQANESTDIFIFTENVRGRKENVPITAGGNLLWEIPISRKACSIDPTIIRNCIQTNNNNNNNNTKKATDINSSSNNSTNNYNNYYYPPNKLPIKPFLFGKVGRITSLATITEQVVYDGMKQLCTIPCLSFIKQIPMDVGIIFRFNKDYFGILHNFKIFAINNNNKDDDSLLLKEIMYTNE